MKNQKFNKPLPVSAEIIREGCEVPKNIDLEAVVLGSIIMEQSSFHLVSNLLFPEMFYDDKHRTVCHAIINLDSKSEKIDILTVAQELKRMGRLQDVGGSYGVSTLTNRIASSSNIETHVRILHELHIKRTCIQSAELLINNAYQPNTDSLEILEELEKSISVLNSKLFSGKSETIQSLFIKMLEENKLILNNKGSILGVPSGFHALDTRTQGWQKTNLIVLAARPGVGKSAFMIQSALNAAKLGVPVGIFSLEMSAMDLIKRMCSQETQIPLEVFMRKGLDEGDEQLLNRDITKLLNSRIYLDDTGGQSLSNIRNIARKWKRQYKIGLLAVDYLQLVTAPGNGNREQEVSEISRGLKALAKELEIPIIALSQLSRESEKNGRTGNPPRLSDLRESGAIEQDADIVLFLHSLAYYGIFEDANGESTKGNVDVLISKNRSGALDTIALKWDGTCTRFANYHDPASPLGIISKTTESLDPNTEFLINN